MNDKTANAILALAALESRASIVAAQAMQARILLALTGTSPKYSDKLRLVRDTERVQELGAQVSAALAGIEEATCSDES